MLKDTRFILVQAEYPYVQFATAARVISTDQGGARIIDGRKKKNQRQRKSFEGVGSSFSFDLILLTW